MAAVDDRVGSAGFGFRGRIGPPVTSRTTRKYRIATANAPRKASAGCSFIASRTRAAVFVGSGLARSWFASSVRHPVGLRRLSRLDAGSGMLKQPSHFGAIGR